MKKLTKSSPDGVKVLQKWSPGCPKASKMESKIDENSMKIGVEAPLGQSSLDFGLQGLPRPPF